jgi:tetratricopeptide (TPR) repeat protein
VEQEGTKTNHNPHMVTLAGVLLEGLTSLQRRVEEVYQETLQGVDVRDQALPSIADLALDSLSPQLLRREIRLVEVLQDWRALLVTLKEAPVIVGDHMASLQVAWEALSETHASAYRHCRTLVQLIQYTAQNQTQDDSTECRFVTLLEVLASYGSQWTTPSETVEAFWVRLMQRIPAQVSAIHFRRKAYRVLVSLSWVPSSRGLLAACSFDEKRALGSAAAAVASSNAAVRGHFRKVRAPVTVPLPRHDSVNQILDRLKDETDVCVGVTSELDGVGKTTMAALVASHPSILKVFTVAWLSMTNEWHAQMDYGTYTKHLNCLCEQLALPAPAWPVCEKRFEEAALRTIREENFMRAARARMAEVMRALDKNILLVLDDVTEAQQIELFRFHERQSVIVTATDASLPFDWNVRLDVLSPDEALEVFLAEVQLPFDHVAGGTPEVRRLVDACDSHALTIRTVGRWCRMRCVTAGLGAAIQGVDEAMGPLAEHAWERIEARVDRARLAALKSQEDSSEAAGSDVNDDGDDDESEQDDDPSTLLFDLLSLMMGPDRRDGNGTSVIFVLCFAAMVVVFPEKVPLDVALLLWEQILRDEPLAQQEWTIRGDKDECQRRAWYVAEGLFHMGVVSIVDDDKGQAWIESHHEAYSDFAMVMAKELDLGDTFEETCKGWHKAFVTAYFNQRINGNHQPGEDEANSWEYAVEKLPDHIFRANMLSMAETILADDNFFQARIDAMGWERAIQVHIRDCVQLQQRLEQQLEQSLETLTLSAVFTRTAAMVSDFAEGKAAKANSWTVIQVSRALYDIGIALAEHGYFEDAMIQFEAAQSFIPESQALRASILYAMSWVFLASGDIPEGLQKIKACRLIMESSPEHHPLYKETLQLYADALIEKCEYMEALDTVIKIEEELMKDVEANWIELGSVLKTKGRLLHTVGRLGEATAAYEKSLEWKEQIAENSQGLAATYIALGDVMMEAKQFAGAKDHYENALHTLRELNCNPNHVNYTLTVGKARFLMGDYKASLSFLALAHLSISSAPLLVMDQSAYDLRCIARMFRSRGELETAIVILQESLMLTNHRPGSLERALSLTELGRCYVDKAEPPDAIKSLRQALDIQTDKIPENLQVIETLSTLGHACSIGKDYNGALEYYVKANLLMLRIAPDDTAGLANFLYRKGEVYEAKDERETALENYSESVSVFKQADMNDHVGNAKAMHAIGRMTSMGSLIREAVPYFQEAGRIRRMHFDDAALAETQQALGVLASKIGDHEMAEENLLEALTIRKNKNGDKRLIAETLVALGNNYVFQSNTATATKIYEESLGLLRDDDGSRGSVYFALGNLKVGTDLDVQALPYFRRARDLRASAYGEDDTRVARAALSLALVHFLENQREEASSLLREYILISGRVEKHKVGVGDWHQRTIQFLLAHTLLGDVLFATDQDSALDMWNEACELCGDADLDSDLVDMVVRRLRLNDGSEIDLEPAEEACLRKYIFTVDEPTY